MVKVRTMRETLMPKKLTLKTTFPTLDKYELAYVAGPYWHEDPKIRCARYDALTALTRALLVQGYTVFSPITHGHAIATSTGIWPEVNWLEQVDLPLLRVSKVLIIFRLNGWRESKGLQREIAITRNKLHMKILHITPEQFARLAPCK